MCVYNIYSVCVCVYMDVWMDGCMRVCMRVCEEGGGGGYETFLIAKGHKPIMDCFQ